MRRDLALLLRSLPHLRPTQVPERAARLAAETGLLTLGGIGAIRGAPQPLMDGTALEPSPRLLLWRLRPEDAARVAAGAAAGSFEFLGVRREFGSAIRWEDPTVPRLWRFELHSFDVAWAFAAISDPAPLGPGLGSLVERWHQENPPRRGDSWHPFVVAGRLVNLLGTRGLWLPGVRNRAAVSAGLWQQARFLRATLERDVGGNHLIREAVALLAAGRAFGHERLTRFGCALLLDEAERQVLPDGGHFERSASYHLEVMTDLAEALALLPKDDAARSRIGVTLARMADAALSLCHPDRQVAMFNDASFWPVPVDAYLGALGLQARRRPELPDWGYFSFGSDGDRLLFDAGPPSPEDLPPHAHCDLLSIEVSVGGRRMIVNSGTGDYERGPWRDYWRSTRAHNTVEIDGHEQSEVWHSFRMARRAAPFDVISLLGPKATGMTGAHDGYRRLRSPVTHRRTVVHTHGLWLVLDFLEGTGRHSLRSFLHLDPSVAAAEAPGCALLTAAGSSLRVVPFGPLPLRIVEARTEPIESWHADHLGERCPGRALVLEGSLDLPVAFGWLLVPGGVEASLVVSPAERGFLARVDLPSGPVRIERDGPVLRAEAAR